MKIASSVVKKWVKQDQFQGHDYYNIDALLSQEHRLVREAVRDWVKQEVSPIIEEHTEQATFPQHLIQGLAEIGAFGVSLPEKYGCGGMDNMTYCLIMQELERGDSSIRSAASVQSSLVMYPIYKFGTEAQRRKYLPKLAKGELIGCFGLTEPNHGSNPKGMESRIVDDGDVYILNGAKMWITNAPIADIAVVWAKDESGKIRGMIVERGMQGFSTTTIHGKWSFRASLTGELIFDNVRVPKANVFEIKGLRGPLTCLSKARLSIVWGAIGAAMECYDTALRYSKERIQFGRPIGGFQLTQKKMAEMITEITKAQLLAWRLTTLVDEEKASPAQISMAKRNNVKMALDVAREARQILGGIGLTNAYPIMRHLTNLETLITYEGTHDIHLLITGQDITGINAFE